MNKFIANSERKVLIITDSYDEIVYGKLLPSDGTNIVEHRQSRYQIQQCESSLLVSLEIYLQEAPDCVLLDWELPNLDREKILQLLNSKQIPVVILVSAANEELISLIEQDYQDYLVKETLTKELIFSTLRNAIAQAEQKQNLIHNRSAALLEMQNRCLGCIAMGDIICETFNLLCQIIELQIPDALCSILTFDDQGRLSLSAPSLPENFILTINALSISEVEALFGNNIAGRTINITDIDNHHLHEYQDLALTHGLRTCWTTPILARDGKQILGFFVLYYRELLTPSLEEIKVIKNIAYAVGIAIERDRSESDLQQQLQREHQLYQQLQQELSDRKRSEEALQISEAHHRALIRAIPDLIMRMNRAGIYLEFLASPNFHVIGNISNMVGTHISQTISPAQSEERIAQIYKALETNKVCIYEQIFDVDGTAQIEEVRIVPYTENEVLLLVRDISDYKLAEKRLKQSEKRFERIALSLPGYIFTVINKPDGSHYFEYISAGVERIHEVTIEQVLQSSTWLDEQHHPDDLAGFVAASSHSVATMTPFKHEWRIITPSGNLKWLELISLPEKINKDSTESDRITGSVARHGIVLDITDRKLAEIQVQQQANHQSLISSISQRIRASLNLEETLNTTVAEIHQVLQSDRVLVYQIYANGTGAVIAESVSPRFTSILDNVYPEETFPAEVYDSYLNGRVCSLEDIENGSVSPCLVEFLQELQVRAKLVIPIIQDQLLWGLLVIHQCDRTRAWQDTEIELLLQLSSQFAIAIQQTSLYQQLQLELRDRQRAEQLIRQQAGRESLLHDLMQRIRQSLDLPTIFDIATLEIRQFLQADRVGIFKFAPESNFNDGEFVAESVVPEFDSVVAAKFHDDCFGEQYAESYHYGKFQAVDDIYNAGLHQCHIDILSVFQIRANLVVPLLSGTNLWGLLCIHQCSSPRHWETEEISLVQQFSNQLAIAIQQASLYQQVQEELVHKEALYLQLANELHQKKVLLKEVHHRVKNNLQVMSSLLRMQFRKTTPELKVLIEEYQNRIQSMALIHAQLHNNEDLANINFQEYIADLMANLFQCYVNHSEHIEYKLDVINIFLPLEQSISLGLIINELISNSLKYAFPHGSGEINIQLTQTENQYHLIVADDGIGLPPDLDLASTETLGMQLVHSLTDQLEGTLLYNGKKGTKFQVFFPVVKSLSLSPYSNP